jgi:PTS system mannitol-specific IIA component
MSELDKVSLASLLDQGSIELDARADDREGAIRLAGTRLVEVGAVAPAYVDAMLERESSVSTYVGDGIAMPHGTLDSKQTVERDALSVLRFTEAVDWNGEQVTIVIGIAARGRGYIALLSRLAALLLDADNAQALRRATTTAEVYAILGNQQ